MSARRPGRSSVPAPQRMKGTRLVVWAVMGLPSGCFMSSALPWSAVTMAMPPIFNVASTTLPTHWSTVSTALMAASSTPVWPPMSQLAKFRMITSYAPDSMRSTHLSHTS